MTSPEITDIVNDAKAAAEPPEDAIKRLARASSCTPLFSMGVPDISFWTSSAMFSPRDLSAATDRLARP